MHRFSRTLLDQYTWTMVHYLFHGLQYIPRVSWLSGTLLVQCFVLSWTLAGATNTLKGALIRIPSFMHTGFPVHYWFSTLGPWYTIVQWFAVRVSWLSGTLFAGFVVHRRVSITADKLLRGLIIWVTIGTLMYAVDHTSGTRQQCTLPRPSDG